LHHTLPSSRQAGPAGALLRITRFAVTSLYFGKKRECGYNRRYYFGKRLNNLYFVGIKKEDIMKRLVEESSLLFGDRLAPMTSTLGFLEADHILAAQTFCDWLEPIMQKARGASFTQRLVSGKLAEILALLLPLTSVERRRYLFVPTASSWTAFFDNGHHGTDVFSKVSRLSKLLECKGLRVVAVPETKEGEFKGARGRYGAIILEVYGNKESVLNYLRAICLINDGG